MRTITVNTATYAQANGSIATFSGVISDGASAYNSLNKAGAGTLRLTNTNTYTGITLIQAGNIAITSTGNLGTNPLVNLGGGALSTYIVGEGALGCGRPSKCRLLLFVRLQLDLRSFCSDI